MSKIHPLHVFVSLLLMAQVGLWFALNKERPNLAILPPLPSDIAVKAESLSDEEFYFRLRALQLQHAGDTFGRFTPLKNYDYKLLKQWMLLMDKLDVNSDMMPTLAAYYFSQTQHPKDVKYLVDYLVEHVHQNPTKNWWWLSQAVYLTNHKLEDKDRALKLAYELSEIPGDLPMWARQMPAFIHEQRGEMGDALVLMEHILAESDKLSTGEFNFIRYFIEERLKKFSEVLSEQEKERVQGPQLPEKQKP